MTTNKQRVLLTLAACAIALAALGSTKNPVQRPFKISGHVDGTLTAVDANYIYYEFTDVGEATHMGPYVNTGTYQISQSTGLFTGSGVATADNGDTVTWVMAGNVITGTWTTTWTGGTGRFVGAVGGFVGVTEPVSPAPTVSFDYTGEGTITY
jgi:hypothetical protein